MLIDPEIDALGPHLVQTPVDQMFFHLEIGNAVTQESAGAILFLEDDHVVARAAKLLGTCKTRRARADDRHALSGSALSDLGREGPPHLPRLVGYGMLDRLDADRIVVDVEDARRLARGRTDPTGDFRKVVRRMQRVDGALPVLLVDEVVPVRNDVVDGTAAHAERGAAVHAACALNCGLLVRQARDELAPVLDAFLRRLVNASWRAARTP